MTHAIAGARGTVEDPEETLREAQAWASAVDSDVLLADASAVFGRDHVESAALHAERARSSNRMATRSLSMEALLYLSGRRQVADAIRVAGLRRGAKAVAVLVFGNAPVEELIHHLGWTRDDDVLAPSGKDLSVLGIGGPERATLPSARIVDLALERTALVDLTKG